MPLRAIAAYICYFFANAVLETGCACFCITCSCWIAFRMPCACYARQVILS
jgi:hypothetical protein